MVKVNQIVKANLLNEVILYEFAHKVFILEKGLGVLHVDEKEFDFRIGRAYIIPAQSALKITGYVSSGFLLTIYDEQLLNSVMVAHFRSNQTKLIDLSWMDLRRICGEIRSVGYDFMIEKQEESAALLLGILGLHNR